MKRKRFIDLIELNISVWNCFHESSGSIFFQPFELVQHCELVRTSDKYERLSNHQNYIKTIFVKINRKQTFRSDFHATEKSKIHKIIKLRVRNSGFMYIILIVLELERAPFKIKYFEYLIMTSTQPKRWIMLNDFLSFLTSDPRRRQCGRRKGFDLIKSGAVLIKTWLP